MTPQMDTIGDAYIAATLLPPGPNWADNDDTDDDAEAGGCSSSADQGRRQQLLEACIGALEVARAMIEAVEEHRPLELRCRIGLSVGPVMAGVVGRLQVRSPSRSTSAPSLGSRDQRTPWCVLA